jgi:hypothetical protein
MRLDASDGPVGEFTVRDKPSRLKVAGELCNFDREFASVPDEEVDANLLDPFRIARRSPLILGRPPSPYQVHLRTFSVTAIPPENTKGQQQRTGAEPRRHAAPVEVKEAQRRHGG